MDVKLVAIDMDGTLLNSRNQISIRNKKAIEKASNLGVEIILATGRFLISATNYAEMLELSKPIIASNGAVVVDEKRNKIYERSLTNNEIERLMDLGDENNIYYHLYDEDTLYANTYIEEIAKYYENRESKVKGKAIKINIFKNKDEILDNENINIYKVLFADQGEDRLNLLRSQLNQIKEISITSSMDSNLEVMDKGVSKGKSLEYLCEKLGISKDKVMAIGDNENDISMLEYAGIGVAMENAKEETKFKSDIITLSNDEDGVAEVIEKYILKEGYSVNGI